MPEKGNDVRVVTLTDRELEALLQRAVAAGVAQAQADIREVLTTEQAAALLGFNTKTLREMVDRGEVPAHRIGVQYRFRRSELLAFVSNQPARVA